MSELQLRMVELAVELNYVLDDDLSDAMDDAVAQLCYEFKCDDVDWMYDEFKHVIDAREY